MRDYTNNGKYDNIKMGKTTEHFASRNKSITFAPQNIKQ